MDEALMEEYAELTLGFIRKIVAEYPSQCSGYLKALAAGEGADEEVVSVRLVAPVIH